MITDCKPYIVATEKEVREKCDSLLLNEHFLAYNYKSNFSYKCAKATLGRIRTWLAGKEFHGFRTSEGYRIFRTL